MSAQSECAGPGFYTDAETALQANRIAAMSPAPWQPEEVDTLVQTMIDQHQPRIGAVVQYLGENVDATIAGWVVDCGDDRVGLVASAIEPIVAKVSRPEHALAFFRCAPLVRNELRWCGPRPTDIED